MSVSGTYEITVQTPLGKQTGSLTLTVEESSLTGTLVNSNGSFDLTDGRVHGNEVQFTTKIKTPMGKLKAQISGKVEGDTFKGTANLPLGSAEIEGIRKI